jgi:hypothetical protein
MQRTFEPWQPRVRAAGRHPVGGHRSSCAPVHTPPASRRIAGALAVSRLGPPARRSGRQRVLDQRLEIRERPHLADPVLDRDPEGVLEHDEQVGEVRAIEVEILSRLRSSKKSSSSVSSAASRPRCSAQTATSRARSSGFIGVPPAGWAVPCPHRRGRAGQRQIPWAGGPARGPGGASGPRVAQPPETFRHPAASGGATGRPGAHVIAT